MAHDTGTTKCRRTSASPNLLVILTHGEPINHENVQHTFTRDANFWLEDGNLILLAGKTAFRVLRSILVKKSAVFADMFATASRDATEIFDDCPVVHLPDHPEDLRDFLQYLMPCSPLRLLDGAPTVEFAELHAAVHLAHKYQCPDVEARALAVLKEYYTPRFSQYNDYAASTPALSIPVLKAAIAAINVARLTATPSMLPLAFYRLCDLGGGVLDGYTRRDGSVEHLSADDLRLCMNAQRRLAWELSEVVDAVFALTPSAQCKAVAQCSAARETMHIFAQIRARGRCNVVESQRRFITAWAVDLGLCGVCKREMLRTDVEQRRRVWMRLPGMFELEGDECGFTDDHEESDSDSD